jgi:hypothetical protein
MRGGTGRNDRGRVATLLDASGDVGCTAARVKVVIEELGG